MPYRASFNCLWCGRPHEVRAPSDLEGWAQLCPDCLGRAGENEFLRFRLKDALAERARATSAEASAPPARSVVSATPDELDDWLLGRGAFARGAIQDAAWAAELDAAGRWLDDLPMSGRIVELAGGTGWWSPLLAPKGELTVYDARPAALDRARARLLAHRLRAHLHVRAPDAEPEGDPADAVVAAWLLGADDAPRHGDSAHAAAAWLRPGGLLAVIDITPEASAGWNGGLTVSDLGATLTGAGLQDVRVEQAGRLLVLGTATASGRG